MGSTGKLASSSELDRSLTFGDVAGVDQAKSQVQVMTAEERIEACIFRRTSAAGQMMGMLSSEAVIEWCTVIGALLYTKFDIIWLLNGVQ